MAAAAMVAIAAGNVYVANNKEKASTIALSQVEAQAGNSSEWTWNHWCDWLVYGLRADEYEVYYDCVTGVSETSFTELKIKLAGIGISISNETTKTNSRPYGIDCKSGGNENCDEKTCN